MKIVRRSIVKVDRGLRVFALWHGLAHRLKGMTASLVMRGARGPHHTWYIRWVVHGWGAEIWTLKTLTFLGNLKSCTKWMLCGCLAGVGGYDCTNGMTASLVVRGARGPHHTK